MLATQEPVLAGTTASGTKRGYPQALIPIAIGIVAFCLIVGPRVLDPTNIAWLQNGDPAQHYLGWMFFRNSPWSVPVGLNPAYGIELSNGIVFSDSNPLLALLFKPLAAILPTPFQYFGIWLLACFILQAWFAWQLAGLMSARVLVRGLVASLFSCAPPMLWRLQGHLSLAGHFLILAALYFLFNPNLQRRRLAWNTVLVVAAMVHGYLLAMVGLLWMADLADRAANRKATAGSVGAEFAVGLVLVTFSCWQVGYFSVSQGLSTGGFGRYRTNLLALFDSSGWSYILKDIPEGPGADSGSNYLGLGFIFLLVCCIPLAIAAASSIRRRLRGYRCRLAVLVACAIFAISHTVALGPYVFEYPLPAFMLRLFNVFRASERFFWPVFYALCFAICFVVVRRAPHRWLVPMLGIAVIVQFLDTSSAWLAVRKSLMVQRDSRWPSALNDPFWNYAASKYKKLRWIRPEPLPPRWQQLTYYAGTHGLMVDAVYLARVSEPSLHALRLRSSAAIASGQYDPDSLYVLDARSFRSALSHVNLATDGVGRIDGFNLVAPGWKSCPSCPRLEPGATVLEVIPELQAGQLLKFDQGGKGADALGNGWSVPEPEGVWSDGDRAELVFRLKLPVKRIVLDLKPFVTATHPRQRLAVIVNGIRQEQLVDLKWASNQAIELALSNEAQRRIGAERMLRIEFTFFDSIKPRDAGYAEGDRELGISLLSLTAY